MKFLASLLSVLMVVSAFGAQPSYTAFRGTGGISIVSNPPTGTIVIDGSGVFTSSGTNASVSTATNGTKVNVAATNINFISSRNIFLRATNANSGADVQVNLASNIVFTTTDGGVYYVGAFGSGATTPGTNFGIWDATAGNDELTFWRSAAGKWIFNNAASMSALTVRSMPGAGSVVAVDGTGNLFRTNSILNPGAFNVSTGNVAISGVATQINLVAGNNIFFRGTNASDKASISVNVASNLLFFGVGGDYMLGTDANGNFGFSNRTTGRWSLFNPEGASDNWNISGTFGASNVFLATLLGSGNYAAIDSNGSFYRTNNPAASSQGGSSVLTNLVGTVANNVTNFVSLSTSNSTSKPLTNSYASGVVTVFGLEAGANVTVTPNGSNLVIAASSSAGQNGSPVLTNLVGTVANNVTNFISLSTSNATSKPLTNSYTAGVVKVYGIEAGANVTVTPNASNLVIASTGGFSVSGNSNQIAYLNVAGTGFTFGAKDKSAPGFGFQQSANGNIGGVLLHVDKDEDTGLVQIGPPNPASNIANFVPSLSVSNRYAYNGSAVITQEMVRVNYVDIDTGSSSESFIQTWKSWVSGVPPASTLNQFAAGLRKDGQLMLAHGVYYPSNNLANDGFGNATIPTAAQLGLGGFWTGISNNSLVTVYSLNGSTTAMKVLAP